MNMEAHLLTEQAGLPPCTEVLGAPVHIIDIKSVLRLMEQWIRERDRPHWIAVTGSHGALEAHKHPDFRAVLHTADLSVPDGRWAARVAAKKMSCATHQVRGADLMSAFCELSRRRDIPITFTVTRMKPWRSQATGCGKKHPGVKNHRRVLAAFSRSLLPKKTHKSLK